MTSGSDHGKILVLVMNELGDHQMETYFHDSAGGGGLCCWDETMGAGSDDVFREMTMTYKQAFQYVGGQYIPQKHEAVGHELHNDRYPDYHNRPCAMRLARNVFFEVRLRDRCSFDD